MAIELSFAFPSDRERILRQVEIERDWTPTERIAAVAESLALVRKLAAAGGRSEEQFEHCRRSKEIWRQRMKEFIAQQVQHAATTTDH